MTTGHLPRHFCLYAERDEVLRWNGFIQIIPETERVWYSDSTIAREWDDYAAYPSIVLLGPPRFGKTTEFRHQASVIPHGFFLALRDLIDENDISSALQPEVRKRFEKWLNGCESGELFIDALDEGNLDAKKLIPKTTQWLRALGGEVHKRLRVHISCRENDWLRLDSAEWENLCALLLPAPGITDAGKEALGDKPRYIELALLDLSQGAIERCCREFSIDPRTFLSDLPDAARPLITSPQTLAMMLNEYRRDSEYLTDIHTLYERTIALRLKEENELYQRVASAPVALPEKAALAMHLALLSLLTGREVIDLDAADSHPSHLYLTAGRWQRDEIKQTLSSALFEPYSEHGRTFRFVQPDIANYLAAKRMDGMLQSGRTDIWPVTSLLYPATGGDILIPKLRELSGWLASMNRDFRDYLLSRTPITILHQSQAPLTIEEKQGIWRWLVNKYGQREWFNDDEFLPYRHMLGGDELREQLEQYCTKDGPVGQGLRLFALETIQKSATQVSADSLLRIINDPGEVVDIRRTAAKALSSTHPDRTKELIAWLYLSKKEDPDYALLTEALEQLYPHWIDTEVLVRVVRNRRSERRNIGRFHAYLPSLVSTMNTAQLELLLNVFSARLSRRLKRYRKNHYSGTKLHDYYYPEFSIKHFLNERLERWQSEPGDIRWLDRWLSAVEGSNHYGALSESEISEYLLKDAELRRKLVEVRLERLYKYFGNKLHSWRLFNHRIEYLSKDDLRYWWEALLAQLNEGGEKYRYYWELFLHAWELGDYTNNYAEHIVDSLNNVPQLAELWSDWRQCEWAPDAEHCKWRIKNAQRRKKEKEKFEQERQEIARLGKEMPLKATQLLVAIENYGFESNSDTPLESLVQEQGGNIEAAYQQALDEIWRSLDIASLLKYWGTNEIPWVAIWAGRAVARWVMVHPFAWHELEAGRRQKAIVAMLFELTWHDWMADLLQSEPDFTHELFTRLLNIEAGLSEHHPRLASLLDHHGEWNGASVLAREWIAEHPSAPLNILRRLMPCALRNGPPDVIVEQFFQKGKELLLANSDVHGLFFLTVALQQKPERVWPWLKANLLDERECVLPWLEELNHYMPQSGFGWAWPHWLPLEYIAELFPLLLQLAPYDRNGTTVWPKGLGKRYRVKHLYELQDNAITLLAGSGEVFSGELLRSWIERLEGGSLREKLLNALDYWEKKKAEQAWQPLSPDAVIQVLEQGKRPVRSHEELFALAVEVVEDIREQIQQGEFSLKPLLWNASKPKREEALQNFLADKITYHPRFQRESIVVARELAVQGNFPDIFSSCKLPGAEREIRVYMELKRQQNEGLFTAINEQLAEKYLSDPQSRYGLYVVGWYGSAYTKISATRQRESCGTVPATAQELEECLQRLCDAVAAGSRGIAGIRAVVIDLSLS